MDFGPLPRLLRGLLGAERPPNSKMQIHLGQLLEDQGFFVSDLAPEAFHPLFQLLSSKRAGWVSETVKSAHEHFDSCTGPSPVRVTGARSRWRLDAWRPECVRLRGVAGGWFDAALGWRCRTRLAQPPDPLLRLVRLAERAHDPYAFARAGTPALMRERRRRTLRVRGCMRWRVHFTSVLEHHRPDERRAAEHRHELVLCLESGTTGDEETVRQALELLRLLRDALGTTEEERTRSIEAGVIGAHVDGSI